MKRLLILRRERGKELHIPNVRSTHSLIRHRVSNPFYAEQSNASRINGTQAQYLFPSQSAPSKLEWISSGHQLAPKAGPVD